MFTEILKEDRLKDILKIFNREFKTGSIESDVSNEIKSILNELYLKNNEFVDELVRDRTLLRLKKTKGLRNRSQDGHIQLVDFKNWLLNNLRGREKIDLDHFIETLLVIINSFEDYVLKLKDRETSIISVQASLKSLIVAILAIGISIVSIVLVTVL